MRWLTLLLVLITTMGCHSGREQRLRIGAKPFDEQAVLAQMLQLLIHEQNLRSEIIECEGSYGCQRQLRSGDLDLFIEYTGTALQFVGGPAPDHDHPVEQVRALSEPLGLRWLEPLGFDNGYRVLVDAGLAANAELETIGDLEQLEEGIQIACPPEFMRRSRDGLPALLRRYGLRLQGEPLVIIEPMQRFHSIQRGQANVVIGYATDGALAGLGLTELSDSLGFFPPYQAAIVARGEVLEEHDGLEEQLGELSGQLTDERMRAINYATQVEGQPPRTVALRFLREHDLLDETSSGRPDRTRAQVFIARNDAERLGPELSRATRALRHLFPGRTIRHQRGTDPLELVDEGRAAFAVVSAERFFDDVSVRDERFEAVAVLATHLVHAVRRADDAGGSALDGRVGLQPEVTSGGRVGRALLNAHQPRANLSRRPISALLEAIREDELDVAVIVADENAPEIARALRAGGLRLAPLDDWFSPERAVRLPYLQRTRLPASTYSNQDDPVDTLSVQVVLVAPSRNRASTAVAGAAGPAAALPEHLPPISPDQLERLSEATGIHEVPDAILPSAWTSGTSERGDDDWSLRAVLETTINAATIAFIAWIGFILFRKRKSSGPDLPS